MNRGMKLIHNYHVLVRFVKNDVTEHWLSISVEFLVLETREFLIIPKLELNI